MFKEVASLYNVIWRTNKQTTRQATTLDLTYLEAIYHLRGGGEDANVRVRVRVRRIWTSIGKEEEIGHGREGEEGRGGGLGLT